MRNIKKGLGTFERRQESSGLPWRGVFHLDEVTVAVELIIFMMDSYSGSNGSSAQFEEAWTPQQQNGYDCGLYVMAIAEVLLQAYTRGLIGSIKCRGLLQEKITAQMMSQMRVNVLNTILTLANSQRSA
jgi:Ulp1 family protease